MVFVLWTEATAWHNIYFGSLIEIYWDTDMPGTSNRKDFLTFGKIHIMSLCVHSYFFTPSFSAKHFLCSVLWKLVCSPFCISFKFTKVSWQNSALLHFLVVTLLFSCCQVYFLDFNQQAWQLHRCLFIQSLVLAFYDSHALAQRHLKHPKGATYSKCGFSDWKHKQHEHPISTQHCAVRGSTEHYTFKSIFHIPI